MNNPYLCSLKCNNFMNIQEIYEIYRKYPIITTDSRNCLPGSVFVALKGESFNGNAFVEDVLKAGCAYAIADDRNLPKNERIILVDDTLRTLQQLANYHRKQLGIPVLAITGTNGKTTTKELVSSVLSEKYKVLYTQGNLNNHIGVPLTLLRLTAEHEMAVIEMGASHQGEIGELSQITEPDYGLITNVGKAHLEGFGSFENIIKTKGELYDFIRKSTGKIFINKNNGYLNEIADGINKIYYGNDPGLYVWGNILKNAPFLSLEWYHEEEIHQVDTRLIGAYNLENVLAAVAIGIYFNVPSADICSALENYTPQNNRSQLMDTQKNHLIIDAYNANPTSMLASLNNFGQMDVSPKAVLLGDMKELGEYSRDEHQKVIDLIRTYSFDKVFLCGENFFELAAGTFPAYLHIDDLTEALKNEKLEGYYILIKGSRSIKLEKTIEFL